ncbi:branched-chain amino acid aminotransferase [Litchfieldia salsa]|uniref:Branched-chain amino acid aminotransferase n=1 Tax=Litchfieldia salsa TaxID=930152 RepID=A0A1H0TAA3_9BACI|nr:branched-chain amino acid aminotransferase [Litchfieldia salsa]SDP50972.1 hypothetical protein SAMN05216565_103378 [Litchfieldia salsa]
MLKKQIEAYVNLKIDTEGKGHPFELFKEEFNYVNKYNLLPNNDVNLNEIDSSSRFDDAYIERCDKETENVINEENSSFLDHPITYLKEHKNEFIYLESSWFDLIGVDAISIEQDDVFGNYDVMLGLKLQKKMENELKKQLLLLMQEDESSFDVIFSHDDGLWNVNFSLNDIKGFNEEMSIKDAYNLIYSSIFNLVEEIEKR